MSAPAADAIGVAVGDRLPAAVDPGDPLLRNTFPRPVTAVDFEVVGTFTVRDRAARYWFDDRTLAEVAIGGTDDNPIAFATAVFAPEAYEDLIRLDLPNRYRWNLFVDVDRLDAGTLDVLEPDLRRLDATFVTTGAARPGRVLVRSGLLGLVERYLGQRTTTEAALSVAALGPLAVAAGAVGLIGILVVRRRRPALALARGRGASSGQLLAAQLWEGLLITVPAALIGLALAVLVVSARPECPVVDRGDPRGARCDRALLAATVPVARRARRDLERDDPPVFRVRPRRLVFEAVVVVIALAAAWLLRERGLTGQTAAGVSRGFDPFLAATPVLIGLAVGLLTIRLFPLPVRGLGWLSARRRDLVPVLGLRSLGRHPSAGYLPLLILTLTMAIGTLSSVLQVSVERSQLEVAWTEVGADYRLESASGSRARPGARSARGQRSRCGRGRRRRPRRAAVDRPGQPGERHLRGDRTRGVRRGRRRVAHRARHLGRVRRVADDRHRGVRRRSDPGYRLDRAPAGEPEACRRRRLRARDQGPARDLPRGRPARRLSGAGPRRRIRRGPTRLACGRLDREPRSPDGLLRRRTAGPSVKACARRPLRAAGRSSSRATSGMRRCATHRSMPRSPAGSRSPSWSPPHTPGWRSWRS